MNIGIIGTGNVATALGRCMKQKNISLKIIVGRPSEHLEKLALELDCAHSSLNDIPYDNIDLFIIALTDEFLQIDIHQLNLGDKPVVHTAGSVSKDVLKFISPSYGVLYPLQSLRKEMDEIPPIPFLIDANNDEMLERVKKLAMILSDQVEQADDMSRMKLHLAAVTVNNFTNHLFALAEKYCVQESIPFDFLKPLMMETIKRVIDQSPKNMQTGPAVRGDIMTIEKHLSLLQQHPELKSIYLKLSDSIMNA